MRGMFKLVAILVAIVILWVMLFSGDDVKKKSTPAKKQTGKAQTTVVSTYIRPGIAINKLTNRGFHVAHDKTISYAGSQSGVSNAETGYASKEGALSCVVAYTISEGKDLYAQIKDNPDKGVVKRRVANVVCLYSISDGSGKFLPNKQKNLDKALADMADVVS